MDSTTDVVRIHYHRPPHRKDVFVQRLLFRSADCVVTFMPATSLARPLIVDGRVVLEDGAPAIWFTFPDTWHDIGRFHLGDGTFTGVYANVITPVEFLDERTWSTTDLFLDIWLDMQGRLTILDEDEFDAATREAWLDAPTAVRGRDEVRRIMAAAAAGAWPPGVVGEWTLDRVRRLGLWPARADDAAFADGT